MSTTGIRINKKWLLIGSATALSAMLIYKLTCGGSTEPAVNNQALLFIKPHGQVEKMQDFVERHLVSNGLKIIKKSHLPGKTIDENGTIDAHYAAIGKYATQTAPKDLPVTAEKKTEFEKKFGEPFDSAAAGGKMMNIVDAMKSFNWSADDLGAAFEAAKADHGLKLAPGCYVAFLKGKGKYVINGFYAKMREEYTGKKAKVSWLVVQWPEKQLSWKNFRAKVLGATDPTAAERGSVRQRILEGAKELGLTFIPSTGKNCVHGSASPLEGLNERLIWVGGKVENDAFGQMLLAAGFDAEKIQWMLGNPTVDNTPLFDLVEDSNSSDCVKKLVELLK